MKKTLIIHDINRIEKEIETIKFFKFSFNVKKIYRKYCFRIDHHDGSIDYIEYDSIRIMSERNNVDTSEHKFDFFKRSSEFQKILNRFESENYRVGSKYISLFIDGKIGKLILQKFTIFYQININFTIFFLRFL